MVGADCVGKGTTGSATGGKGEEVQSGAVVSAESKVDGLAIVGSCAWEGNS